MGKSAKSYIRSKSFKDQKKVQANTSEGAATKTTAVRRHVAPIAPIVQKVQKVQKMEVMHKKKLEQAIIDSRRTQKPDKKSKKAYVLDGMQDYIDMFQGKRPKKM